MDPWQGDNPMSFKSLTEDALHIKIVLEKFQQVKTDLLRTVTAERARSRGLEMRLEAAKEAEKAAMRAAQQNLVTAKDYLLLDKIATKLKDDNKKLKDEIQELKDRAGVDASVAEARVAAWERNSKELQRSLEQERQAARTAAREAREAAENDKKALQDAFQKKEEECRRAHEEALEALRDEVQSVREECAEVVNVAALEFEERAALMAEKVTALQAEKLSMEEQLSAMQGHIEYLESRIVELQHAHVNLEGEKNRLLESNRSLMLQQQSLLAAQAAQRAAQATPRPPRPQRPRQALGAAIGIGVPRFQYSLPAALAAPPAAAQAGGYPQLSMAWRRGSTVAANLEQRPEQPVPRSPPAAPSSPKQDPRRRIRKALEAADSFPEAIPAPSSRPGAPKGRPTASLQPPAPLQRPVPLRRPVPLQPPAPMPEEAPRTLKVGRFTFKKRMFGGKPAAPAAATSTAEALTAAPEETPAPAPGVLDTVTTSATLEGGATLATAVAAESAATPAGDAALGTETPTETPVEPAAPLPADDAAVAKDSVVRDRPRGSRRLFTSTAAPPSFLQFLSKLPASKMHFTVPEKKASPAAAAPPPSKKQPQDASSREDTRRFFERHVRLQDVGTQDLEQQPPTSSEAAPIAPAPVELQLPTPTEDAPSAPAPLQQQTTAGGQAPSPKVPASAPVVVEVAEQSSELPIPAGVPGVTEAQEQAPGLEVAKKTPAAETQEQVNLSEIPVSAPVVVDIHEQRTPPQIPACSPIVIEISEEPTPLQIEAGAPAVAEVHSVRVDVLAVPASTSIVADIQETTPAAGTPVIVREQRECTAEEQRDASPPARASSGDSDAPATQPVTEPSRSESSVLEEQEQTLTDLVGVSLCSGLSLSALPACGTMRLPAADSELADAQPPVQQAVLETVKQGGAEEKEAPAKIIDAELPAAQTAAGQGSDGGHDEVDVLETTTDDAEAANKGRILVTWASTAAQRPAGAQPALPLLKDTSDGFEFQLEPTPPKRCASSLTCSPPDGGDSFPCSPSPFDASREHLEPLTASPALSPPPAPAAAAPAAAAPVVEPCLAEAAAPDDAQPRRDDKDADQAGVDAKQADVDGEQADASRTSSQSISYSPLSSSLDDDDASPSPGALVIDWTLDPPCPSEGSSATCTRPSALGLLRECYEGCSQASSSRGTSPTPRWFGSETPSQVAGGSLKRSALLSPSSPEAGDPTPRRPVPLGRRDKKRRRLLWSDTLDG